MKTRWVVLGAVALAYGTVAALGCSESKSQPSGGDAGDQDAAVADADPGDAGRQPLDATPPRSAKDMPPFAASIFCGRIAECCQGERGAANFNHDACTASLTAGGVFRGAFGSTGSTYDEAKVTYDRDAATSCLMGLAFMSCGDVLATDVVKLQSDCVASLTGKVTASQACASTLECAPGTFCDPTARVCTAVLGTGQSCGGEHERCAFRELATEPNFCHRDAGTCQPRKPLDAGCGGSQAECQSATCSQGTCTDKQVLITPSFCKQFSRDGG